MSLLYSVLPLLVIVSVESEQITEFRSRECTDKDRNHVPCGDIVSLSQNHETMDVYIALENGIYEFDESLRPKSFIFTSDSESNQRNDLMVVTKDNIILCKNDFEGSCEMRDLTSLDVIKGFKQVDVVNTERIGFSLGWVTRGPVETNVLNIALSNRDKNSFAPILSTRYLRSNKSSSPEDFLKVLKNEFSVPASQFLNDRQHSVTIDPVIGFSEGSYNYVVKRQTDTVGESEAKLIRLCRNDINYRSYIELPLHCQDGTGKVLKNVTSAFYSSGVLYLSFYEGTSTKDDNSAICLYNMTNLNNRFQQRRRECLLGKSQTTEIEWYQRIPCPTEPLSSNLFNISYLDDPEFCYELDTANPLGGNDPIVGDALFTVKAKVNAFIGGVFENGMIYFLGDDNGNIIKMRQKDGTWERQTLNIGESLPILSPNGFVLDVTGDWIYAMTHRKATRIRVDFIPVTTTSSSPPSKDPSEASPDQPQSFEPVIIYIISGASGLIVIIIVIILAVSIKFGMKKYKMSVS